MYRLWLSTPLQEADLHWTLHLVVNHLLPRDTIHLHFADSRWQQIKQRYGGDQGDLDQARGVLTIVSPLHDPVLEDHKNFAAALTLLTDKRRRVNWRMGHLRLYFPPTTSRQLMRKRKHDEMMLTEPLEDTMSYHQRRQLVFISQAIRDYTNEGLGLNSFQLRDADPTVRRIWAYLTRHFGRGEINFMVATSIAHIHLLMRSAAPRLLSGIEQSQPSSVPAQGLAYFPPNLQLQDHHRLELHFFDLQALKRASILHRVQQYLKTARSTSDGASAVKNGWRFQQQEQQLRGLSYDRHLHELLLVLPDYQDQIRDNT